MGPSSGRLRPRAQMKMKSSHAEIQCSLSAQRLLLTGLGSGVLAEMLWACSCQGEVENGSAGPDPCPGSASILSSSHAHPQDHGAGLSARQEGAGWVQSCPLLGLASYGQEHPARALGKKRTSACPLETPILPGETCRGSSLTSEEVQAFSSLRASSQRWETALPSFPGKGCRAQ